MLVVTKIMVDNQAKRLPKLKNKERNQDGAGQVPLTTMWGKTVLHHICRQLRKPLGLLQLRALLQRRRPLHLRSSSAAAAASGVELRWGYRRGDAAQRGRMVLVSDASTSCAQKNLVGKRV